MSQQEQSDELETKAMLVAYILGPASSAQAALDELDALRRGGKTARLRRADSKWIVEVDE